MRGSSGGRLPVPDWLSDVVPDWLADVMGPKQTPIPWPDMIRAVFAIWVPLAVGFITGRREIALLPAMGGLLSIMIDQGGPFRARVRRVGTAAVFGGAVGLTIGWAIHGRGWIAVIALIVVAGVSAILARLGAVGSVTGLQLLIYSSLGLGPLGALRPAWHTALEFVAGSLWGLLLITPSWLLSPRGAEQRAVAAVYHAIADGLRAVGTPEAVNARRALTAALNKAYDTLLTGRSASSGRNELDMRLMAILNLSHQMTEAATALRASGERPPPWVTDTIGRLADAVLTLRRGETAPLFIPPPWSASPGALALRDAMVALARCISGNSALPSAPAARKPRLRDRVRERAARLSDQLIGGRIAWIFTLRLMICTGVAAVFSEVLPIQRSYWVVLTVAIILKPDYGSVFSRAVQRGVGTIIGAVLGAAIIALVPYGPWLLLPFGVLAALLPYGKSRSFGLSATFLTPFVVLLIDLLSPGGWRLAEERLIDTLIACAIVLLIGYAPWPSAWYAHLPRQFADTLRAVAAYMDESLVTAWDSGPGPVASPLATTPARRSGLRRQAYRALSNLRAEFQRTMSEPSSVSRRAAAWWPAAVGLEEVMDTTTGLVVTIGRGAKPPDARAVHQLTGTLRAVADAINAGVPPAAPGELPDDPALTPVTDSVRSVLAVLTGGGESGARRRGPPARPGLKGAWMDSETSELSLALAHLRGADPVLARVIDQHASFDPRGWLRELPVMDAFGALIFMVTGQQLSVRSAASILGRIQDLFGGQLPSPAALLAADPADLQKTGLSRRKVTTLRAVAAQFADGSLSEDALRAMSDQEILDRLTTISGIGPWTVHGMLIIALDRADVVLPGDLALRKAVQRAYQLGHLPSQQEVLEIAEPWRPYRSLATAYLFQVALDDPGTPLPEKRQQ